DAHSGNYSVQLTNVMTLLVANGTATNGRIHPNLITSLAYMYTDTADGRWNTPFTSRPDSITGWYKYSPQPSDTLEVQVILHKGYGKQPDNNYLNNWIAQAHFRSGINTGNQWHRFSTPFIYYNDQIPEYVLIILNSGNGFYPVAGSIAWFDDLNMVYGSGTATVKDSEEAPEFVYVEGNQTMVIRSCQPGRYTMAGIMDITGRVVWKEYITSDRIDISRAGLKKGLYLIILTGRNAHHTEKVLLN
ncbi:MAG: PCMD domain-containing protein, partial [Bacteroidales bacterium]|nr:PCMD domain-containing protein [Bacteroidales bacterium]